MSWPKVSIASVCNIVSGATPKTSNPAFWDGDIPWTTPKDLSERSGKHLSDTPRKITPSGFASCSSRMLPVHSVLFSSRAPIGLVAINTMPVCTNQGFKSMVPKNGKIVADFLYWWLRIHRASIERLGRGATFKEVSKKIVEEIQIPLPPLEKQKRIAAILDAAEGLRAKRRESLARLDTLLQSTFLDLFGDPVTNPNALPKVTCPQSRKESQMEPI
ncbi:MAG: restriction endonuclease subunit S [Verrucomicrobiales bacterium]